MKIVRMEVGPHLPIFLERIIVNFQYSFMGFLDYFRQPDGLVNLSPEDISRNSESGNSLVIDVRTKREYDSHHIKGAESHPLGTIDAIIPHLEKDADITLICATGHRSRAAAAKLLREGFSNVSHLEGGMRAWNRAGKETVGD